jgi:hypothetical protein
VVVAVAAIATLRVLVVLVAAETEAPEAIHIRQREQMVLVAVVVPQVDQLRVASDSPVVQAW